MKPHPTRFSPLEVYPRSPRPGKHGYLLFENPESELNKRFVDGQELAGLLVETGVPVLVLNACRSAYAEVRKEPETSNEGADPHQTVRTWGLKFPQSSGRMVKPEQRDRMKRGICLGQLGFVAFEGFKEAREKKRPEEELLRHLNEAASFYHQSLEHFPADAVNELAVTHNQLGEIYRNAGDLDRAVAHYRDAIRYREKEGNVYEASGTRFNVALALDDVGRPQDALEYARAALRGFESYGESAADMIQRTRQLIEEIRQKLL